MVIMTCLNSSIGLNKTTSAFPNGKYSKLFNAAAFSSKSFSDETSFPVKNSYLLTFPDDKVEILAFYPSKLY